MPVTDNACRAISIRDTLRKPPVARARQRRLELTANQLFDEPADAPTDLGLNRINPVVEKMDRSLVLRLRDSSFVLMLVMAWSPVRRFNAG